jgi:hypothetical protein
MWNQSTDTLLLKILDYWESYLEIDIQVCSLVKWNLLVYSIIYTLEFNNAKEDVEI